MKYSVQVKVVIITPGGCSCQVSVYHEGVSIPGGSAYDDPVPFVVSQALNGVVFDVDWAIAKIERVLNENSEAFFLYVITK